MLRLIAKCQLLHSSPYGVLDHVGYESGAVNDKEHLCQFCALRSPAQEICFFNNGLLKVERNCQLVNDH